MHVWFLSRWKKRLACLYLFKLIASTKNKMVDCAKIVDAVVLEYLKRKDKNLAIVYKKKYNVPDLSNKFPKIEEIISRYSIAARKQIKIAVSSSDDSSEDDVTKTAPAIEHETNKINFFSKKSSTDDSSESSNSEKRSKQLIVKKPEITNKHPNLMRSSKEQSSSSGDENDKIKSASMKHAFAENKRTDDSKHKEPLKEMYQQKYLSNESSSDEVVMKSAAIKNFRQPESVSDDTSSEEENTFKCVVKQSLKKSIADVIPKSGSSSNESSSDNAPSVSKNIFSGNAQVGTRRKSSSEDSSDSSNHESKGTLQKLPGQSLSTNNENFSDDSSSDENDTINKKRSNLKHSTISNGSSLHDIAFEKAKKTKVSTSEDSSSNDNNTQKTRFPIQQITTKLKTTCSSSSSSSDDSQEPPVKKTALRKNTNVSLKSCSYSSLDEKSIINPATKPPLTDKRTMKTSENFKSRPQEQSVTHLDSFVNIKNDKHSLNISMLNGSFQEKVGPNKSVKTNNSPFRRVREEEIEIDPRVNNMSFEAKKNHCENGRAFGNDWKNKSYTSQGFQQKFKKDNNRGAHRPSRFVGNQNYRGRGGLRGENNFGRGRGSFSGKGRAGEFGGFGSVAESRSFGAKSLGATHNKKITFDD